VSISPTFYKQLFFTKVSCAAFMCLQFGFVIFWQKDFGTKAAHKMLVKLAPGPWLSNFFDNNLHLCIGAKNVGEIGPRGQSHKTVLL
jgi:hypothetical protein